MPIPNQAEVLREAGLSAPVFTWAFEGLDRVAMATSPTYEMRFTPCGRAAEIPLANVSRIAKQFTRHLTITTTVPP